MAEIYRGPRRPNAIRTADVLAAFSATPLRVADAAKALGHTTTRLSGHITHLHRMGKLDRVERGVYVRAAAAQVAS